METRGCVSLYSWYQHVKKKDLGVTRRDWLQLLRDEAKHKKKVSDPKHPLEDISQRERKIIEEQSKRENSKHGVSMQNFDSHHIKVDSIPFIGGTNGKEVIESNPAIHDESSIKITSPKNDTECRLKDKREGMAEEKIKLNTQSPRTPVQQSKSFSLLDTSFATPTLELLEGDTGTPDVSHTSSLFSPTVPVADIVSTGMSVVNTTRELAASLGGSLDGSVGSWTSALATPSGAAETGGTHHHTTPSTLERLTLHPKQSFRQNVLARSLFSPHTPGANSSSTSEEWSPGLGIIKCHSPLPVFNNKLKSAVSKRVRKSENYEKVLEYGTQGFNVNFHRNGASAKEEEEEDCIKGDDPKRRDGKSTRLGTAEDICPQNVRCDPLEVWNVKTPDKTSTPILSQTRTSFTQHLVLSSDSPVSQGHMVVPVTLKDYDMNAAQNAEIMQVNKKNMNSEDYIGINDMDTSPQFDASEDSYKLSQNPFDLICSPVKKVKPKKSVQVCNIHVNLKKTGDMKDKIVVDDHNEKVVEKSIQKQDGEKRSHDIENMDKSIDVLVTPNLNDNDSEYVDHLEKANHFSHKKFSSGQNVCERNLSPLSSRIIGENAGEDKLEVDKSKGGLVSKCENIDSNQYTSVIKVTPEKSHLCGKSHVSPPSHPVPLFKRVTSCENIDSDQECIKREIVKTAEKKSSSLSEPSQTKSILNKLSLHKKKRLTGKFLYPTKSEEGYEKLNMKYTEVIGQIEKNESSILVPDVSDAKVSTTKIDSILSKSVTDIHTIANRQQNFLSLTKLEKDIRFEATLKPPKNEGEITHKGKEKEVTSASLNQEIPLNFENMCNVDRLPGRCRTPTVASDRTKSEAESTSAGSAIVSSKLSYIGSCDRIGNGKVTIGDTNENNNNLDVNYKTLNSEQVQSEIVSRYKQSSITQNIVSENATRNFEDGHQIEESEILRHERQVVQDKALMKKEVLPVSSLSEEHHCKAKHVVSSQVLMHDGSSPIMNDSLNDIDFSEIDMNVCIPVKDDKNTEKCKSGVRQSTQEIHVMRHGIDCDTNNVCIVENDGCIDSANHDKNFPGILTGRAKQMKVSKEALECGKKVLEELLYSKQTIAQHPLQRDECDDQEYITTETHLTNKFKEKDNHSLMSACSPKSSSGVCGFTTASGLKVTVNEAALKRAKKLWEEENSLRNCNPEKGTVEMTDQTKYLNQDISKCYSENGYDDRGQKSQFIGFKTGKGTAVQVGEASLRRAQEMWHEETKNHVVSGLSKGRTSDVQNSHKSVSHVDLEMHSVGASDGQHSCTGTTSAKVSRNNGFVMASGAKVRISKEALRKAQLLWEENNMATDTDEEESNGRHLQDLPKQGELFKTSLGTGSEKQVSHCIEEESVVSEGSVKKVGSIASSTFLEFNQGTCQRAQDMNQAENSGSLPGSNCVPIETLERNVMTEHINDNIVPTNDQDNIVSIIQKNIGRSIIEINTEENCEQIREESFSGFQTAKGNRVSVNKAALIRAKKLWEESNNSEEENRSFSDSKRISSLSKGSTNEQLMGSPSIVSGARKCKWSALSLCDETPKDVWKEPQPLRLSTAESSLMKVKDIFNGRLKKSEGKGRRISLSLPDGVKQARLVDRELRDIIEPSLLVMSSNVFSKDIINCGANNGLCTFPGFSTARGDQMFVSKEAICRAKNIFDEDLLESDNREKPKMNIEIPLTGHKLVQSDETINFQGFSTARGRKVHISQDALERAQKFLNEETGDEKEKMIQQEKQVSYEDGNFQSHTVNAVGTHTSETLSTKKVVDSNSICKGMKTADNGNEIGSPMDIGKNVILSEPLITKASQHPEEDKTLEESSTRVPALITSGNRASGELQAGEIFNKDLTHVVQTASKEIRDRDLSSCLLIDDVSKGDAIVKTTRRTRQELSAKDKLKASKEETKSQSSVVVETEDSVRKDAKFISRDLLKGNSCSIDVSTDQNGEPIIFSSKTKENISVDKSILVSEAVEPFEGVDKCVTFKENSYGNDECRSSSPILGSQKMKIHCRNSVVKVHGDSDHNGLPVQQHFSMKRTQHDLDTVHSENAELLSFINSDCDSSFSKPVSKKMKFSDDDINFKHRLNDVNLDKDNLNTQSSETHSQPNFKTSLTYANSPLRVCSLPHSLTLEDSLKYKGDTKLKRRSALSTDTKEITEITEAFLKDDPWEIEGAPEGQAARRKWSEGSLEERKESNVCFSKRRRMNADDATTVDIKENADSQVQAELEMMRLKQIKEIQYKEKLSVQPIKGSLYKIRTERKRERRKLKSFGTIMVFSGCRKEVHEVNAKNSIHYRFPIKDKRYESVNCIDGCYVVPGADGSIGVEEIKQGFLAMPGVHPGLLPPTWVTNHYRWIVWKLAALERRLLNCEVLTLESVIARLKYRYDREIDRAERPILRKITEQDDIPQKTMILCVASIMIADQGAARVPCVEIRAQSPNGQASMLELTDGWYSIGAVVDSAMMQLIHDGKVEVGTKLVIHGAELTGSSAACHPLEAPAALRLRLHTNMTRRARWWARLGLLPQKGPLPANIGATLNDGGLVGQMTVMFARVYPMVYFERSNGRSLFRGEKAHMRILKETQQQKETTMHQMITEVEREFSKQTVESPEDNSDQLPMTKEEICNLTMGRDIAQLMDKTLDPCSLESLLTPHQIELARSWRERQAEEKRRNINAEVHRRLAKKQISYEATPLLKVRIVDCDGAGAMATIWRPSEDVRQAFVEHTYFVVHNLMAAGYRNGSLQFTATRQTRWEQIKECPAINSMEFSRYVTPLCLMSSGEFQPLWKEVDIVGVVLRLGQLDRGSQIVHIVDHHVNIVALMVWGGLKDCGVENSVVIGSVISVLNGNWRGHRGGRFGCVHITELTVITTLPRSPHLQEAATHLKESVKDMKTLLHEGDMKLDGQFDSRAYPAEPSSTDARNVAGKGVQEQMDESESRYDGKEDSRVTKTGSGNNHESPQNVEHEIVGNPKLIRLEQRTTEVRSKLKILGQYGTPSALQPIQSPVSTGARKPFRVPFKQLQKSDSVGDTNA